MNPFPDLPAEGRLTDRERAAIDTIAVHEQAADPAFARRLTGAPGRTRVPVLFVLTLAVVGVALLAVPGVWVLAVVAVAVLLVVPTVLVAWALRQGDQPPA